jgi:hypothetical protein
MNARLCGLRSLDEEPHYALLFVAPAYDDAVTAVVAQYKALELKNRADDHLLSGDSSSRGCTEADITASR